MGKNRMNVGRISGGGCQSVGNSVEAVQANLEAIARTHRVSVPELLSSAEAAGSDALPYQTRALVLAKRLDKLQGD